MTRCVFRAVWTLVALCLPVLAHAVPAKFISSGEQAYAEVTVDGRVQKIYTEVRGDSRALLVLGEKNNLEILKFSFVDNSKKAVTAIVEFRVDAKIAVPGRQVAGNEFIRSLSSDADGFKDWQATFSTFPEQPTVDDFVADASFADFFVELFDAEGVFKPRSIRDQLCQCKNGGITAVCLQSGTRCYLDNMCKVWECIWSGHWTQECSDAWEAAKLCREFMH